MSTVTATHVEDRLLLAPEIAELTRMSEGTLRYLTFQGELPFMWKRGRRLVAWESEVRRWLDEQREATRKGRAATG